MLTSFLWLQESGLRTLRSKFKCRMPRSILVRSGPSGLWSSAGIWRYVRRRGGLTALGIRQRLVVHLCHAQPNRRRPDAADVGQVADVLLAPS